MSEIYSSRSQAATLEASDQKNRFAHLDFSMKHRIGPLDLDLAFQLTQPWSLLFAPSGAGKTTVLRAICGLLKPQRARIVARMKVPASEAMSVGSEVLLTDTGTGVFIPPHQRLVRMVSQSSTLFPHLSVLENIRYNTRAAGEKEEKLQAEERLRSLVTLCRVDHLTAKMPSQLSGGERQRVALARSLAAGECRLLLLDECFTGLDATLRDELIVDLRAWLLHRKTPVLSVTHDIAEAFQLDADVLKLLEGRIVQQGPAAEVLTQERSRLLAQLS